ncbi:LysR family transcriptional regulator [Novacetimonas hansenii]|nr:LysR family transcriptional regulator [Novacetimonas hansenii]EFG84878.1 LysR family transcriptional regulator [Novacetimonas hansenii ATCC 23769]
MRDDFEGISVFLKAVEAGGFARAAERLSLSRSAVAKTIGRIEKRLGVRLFQRTTRRHNLTEEGHIYYERCVRAREEVRVGQSVLEFGRFNVKGKLTVIMPTVLGRYCVEPFLLDLAIKYENLELDLRFSDLEHNLVTERFDLAIRNGLDREPTSFLNVRKIAAQRQVLCAAPSYLLRCGPVHSLEDIWHHDALIYWKNEQPCLWKFRDIGGTEFKLPPKWRLQFDNQEAMADAALRGMGIACLPRWLIHNHLNEGRLVSLLDELPLASQDIYAVWPQTKFMSARLSLTIDILSDYLGKTVNFDQLSAS